MAIYRQVNSGQEVDTMVTISPLSNLPFDFVKSWDIFIIALVLIIRADA